MGEGGIIGGCTAAIVKSRWGRQRKESELMSLQLMLNITIVMMIKVLNWRFAAGASVEVLEVGLGWSPDHF